MRPVSSALAAITLNNRSRVGTGRELLVGLDMRSAQGRRLKELITQLQAEFGPDLSESDNLRLINTACWLARVETLLARDLRGEGVSEEDLVRAQNCADRCLERLRKAQAGRRARNKPDGQAALLAHIARQREGGA